MKNIINNPEMISIIDLKKQAKILRKNNKNIKNHSESLQLIANSYGYESWESLLDSSYMIQKKEKLTYCSGQKEQVDWKINNLLPYLFKLKNMINTLHDEYEFLNSSNGFNTLFNFFQINVLSTHSPASPIYQKLKLLIEFMVTAFIESNIKNKEFKNILDYALFRKENPYYKEILSNNAIQKLKRYMRHNDLAIYGFSDNEEVQISNVMSIENLNAHNDVTLILNSVKDKINIMSKSYKIIENNKKDNDFFDNWMSNYENFVSLSTYDEWVEDDLKKYQRKLHEYYGSFFNINIHKDLLKYLNYYNDRYGKIVIAGTKSEVTEKIAISPDTCQGLMLDISKADKIRLGEISTYPESQSYEFIFYYIVH